jgi:murein L,D-transpeptidase YcbB/YkuD
VLWGKPAFAESRYALVSPAQSTQGETSVDGLALSPLAGAIKQVLDESGAKKSAFADALNSAYASEGYEPLWFADGEATRQMQVLRRRMATADFDGLDPADYALPALERSFGDDVNGVAAADVAFSRTVALYLSHLAAGRVDPQSVSRLITLEPEQPAIDSLLPELAEGSELASVLADIEPPHPEYRALKRKLAELRSEQAAPGPIQIPEGKMLKPGSTDERMPLLRERLGLSIEPGADPLLMDEALTEALRGFQSESGLTPDGILGPRTLLTLNGPDPRELIDAIIANMERWRWEPRDFGEFHVAVNVPEFILRVRKGDEVVHQTRVVVGTPKNATPIFSHEMSHLVVNPFWNVPTSIVSKEMMPEIQADPYGYFSKRGYQVLAQAGGKMRVIDPGLIDWRYVDPRAVRIRQVPGDQNALGRIKFMFPNQHAVYLHDTPSKRLFEKDFRAFSHGCVRVDNPLDFAEAILPVAAPKWNSARLSKLYGGAERWVNLDKNIPVHLLYFTVSIDSEGKMTYFEDIYSIDQRFTKLVAKEDGA